jgi:cbb3-type cytochrome oxidase subunit 3
MRRSPDGSNGGEMRRIAWLIFLGLCFLAYGASVASQSQAKAQAQSASDLTAEEIDDIREAVFRYQFEHNASAQQRKAKVYFLSLGKGKAPSDLFMLRFKDHKPPVKPASMLASMKINGAPGRGRVVNGLIFYVTSIEPVDEDEVEVAGGYYEGDLSSSGNRYRVKRKGSRWVVVADRLLYIA